MTVRTMGEQLEKRQLIDGVNERLPAWSRRSIRSPHRGALSHRDAADLRPGPPPRRPDPGRVGRRARVGGARRLRQPARAPADGCDAGPRPRRRPATSRSPRAPGAHRDCCAPPSPTPWSGRGPSWTTLLATQDQVATGAPAHRGCAVERGPGRSDRGRAALRGGERAATGSCSPVPPEVAKVRQQISPVPPGPCPRADRLHVGPERACPPAPRLPGAASPSRCRRGRGEARGGDGAPTRLVTAVDVLAPSRSPRLAPDAGRRRRSFSIGRRWSSLRSSSSGCWWPSSPPGTASSRSGPAARPTRWRSSSPSTSSPPSRPTCPCCGGRLLLAVRPLGAGGAPRRAPAARLGVGVAHPALAVPAPGRR